MPESTMPYEGAVELINGGHMLAHIRHWAGPYVLIKTKFDPDFNEACREIPSWQWMPDQRSFKVHYLDLPTFEAIAFKKTYMVKYGPETIPKLKELRAAYLERREWKKKAFVTIPVKRDLRAYQTIGAQFMYKTQNVLNADGMGAGKSCQTIGAILLNKMDNKPYKTLILCPATMRGIWKNEIEAVTDELKAVTLEGKLEKRMEIYEEASKYDVMIMSYDSFISDYDMIAEKFKPDILTIDECFPYEQSVMTDKGQVPIGRLYHKWSKGETINVKSLNKNGSFEFKPITHAWKRAPKQLVAVKCSGFKFHCTPEHPILTTKGYRNAGDLIHGDEIVGCEMGSKGNRYISKRLNEDQEQALIGSFLGDGNIHVLPSGKKRLRILHGEKQKQYIIDKAKIFGSTVRKINKNGYAGTVAYQFNTLTFNCGYVPSTKKTYVPKWMIDKMDGRAIAIWLMDDGSINHKQKQIQIHTNSFDIESVERLSEKLTSMGVKNKIAIARYSDGIRGEYPYIRLGVDGYHAVMKIAGKYALPSMYKFKTPTVLYKWDNTYQETGSTIVLSVGVDIPARIKKQYLFDLEVKDNHNFVICSYSGDSGIVAHNCHRISNRQNKITQLLIGGRTIKKTFINMAGPHSIFLLTGTPISNKLEDLYAILKLIDPGIFSWTGFANRYTIEEEGQRWMHAGGVSRPHTFRKICGYRNQLELKAKLSLHMIRRSKDEILPELPEKTFQTIEIDLNPEERRAYNTLRKDYKVTIRGKEIDAKNALSWMTRAQQICNSMETLPGSPTKKSSKLEELIRIVEAEAPNRKIVIFSKYAEMTNIICRELKQFHPIHLHGKVKEDRAELIERFQTDDKYRLFVSTIKAGGVGITLTAADMVILYDRWWNPGGNFQAIDRLHRIGQKNAVLALTMRVRDSIEEKIEKIWMKKQITIDEIVGDEAKLTAMTREELEDLI